MNRKCITLDIVVRLAPGRAKFVLISSKILALGHVLRFLLNLGPVSFNLFLLGPHLYAKTNAHY